jgi:acetoin utilization protein AcuB
MIVRHWMHADPAVIASDALVSEANRVLSASAQHALPVVDGGRLRGLVTRVNLLRMGHFVLSTQDSDELNFFATRLRVRDVMVRRPATVQADETMQQCLLKGQALGVAQFPVLDDERVVGVISANEIFQLAAYCLGAWERRRSLTLASVVLGPGVLGHITQVAEAAGAVLHGVYPIGPYQPDAAQGQAGRKLLLRFHSGIVDEIAAALEAAGFAVLESSTPTLAN